jgi:hypothetical protein
MTDTSVELSIRSSIESAQPDSTVETNPRASLLSLPSDLWIDIVYHMYPEYPEGLRVYCCQRHMGPFWSTKCWPPTKWTYQEETAIAAIVKGIMKLRALHSRLYAAFTLVLQTNVTWNLCISYTDHPNHFCRQPLVRFLGTHAYSVYGLHTLRRPHYMVHFMQLARRSRVLIDLPIGEAYTVAGFLQQYEGVDNLRYFVDILAPQLTRGKMEVHFRQGRWPSQPKQPGVAELERPPPLKWNLQQLKYLTEYLKVLQHVPDNISLGLHFECYESRYFGLDPKGFDMWRHEVIDDPLPRDSQQAMHANRLMTATRSKQFDRPRPHLLVRYMAFREWLCSEFVFIHVERYASGEVIPESNRWLVPEDFRLTEEILAVRVQKVWQVHADGDVEAFEKEKMGVLLSRQQWSQDMVQLLMAI